MSVKTPVVTGTELAKAFEKTGFVPRGQKGSHLHMLRESDRRRVTIPIHKGRDLPVGTLKGILKDADMTVEQLRKLL